MTNTSFENFLALPDQNRKNVFEVAANRLGTQASYIEKDFWVCLVLDVLYNRLPKGHPQFLFKGGTTLSKAFNLINRFSEDIDLVVDRESLGFSPDRDPTNPNVKGKQRDRLYKELYTACENYIYGVLATELKQLLDKRCRIISDKGSDAKQQTLLIEYPTLYSSSVAEYIQPRVKLEVGARSALEPSKTCKICPYISEELNGDWQFNVGNINVVEPSRTYLEKLLILHGEYCGYRDKGRLPTDANRISRHYYDVAMITGTEVGASALADDALLKAVREHNLNVFRSAWKKYEEAEPGTIRVVPENALRDAVEKDYNAMKWMMLGGAPKFDWVMRQIQFAEAKINRLPS